MHKQWFRLLCQLKLLHINKVSFPQIYNNFVLFPFPTFLRMYIFISPRTCLKCGSKQPYTSGLMQWLINTKRKKKKYAAFDGLFIFLRMSPGLEINNKSVRYKIVVTMKVIVKINIISVFRLTRLNYNNSFQQTCPAQ